MRGRGKGEIIENIWHKYWFVKRARYMNDHKENVRQILVRKDVGRERWSKGERPDQWENIGNREVWWEN